MFRFGSMRIARKLMLIVGLFGTTLLLCAGGAFVGSDQMADLARGTHEINQGLARALNARVDFERFRGLVGAVPAELDLDKQTAMKEGATEALVKVRDRLTVVQERSDAERAAIAGNALEHLVAVEAAATKVFDFAAAFAQDQSVEVLNGAFADSAASLDGAVTELVEISERRAVEQLAQMEATQTFMLAALAVLTLVSLMVAGGYGVSVARSVAGRLTSLVGSIARMRDQDLDTVIPFGTDRDEIGEIARGLDLFKTAMVERRDMEAQREAEARQREEWARSIEGLIQEFDRSVQEMLSSVVGASTELNTASHAMGQIAEATLEQAGTVASASEQATANVQTVASAAEQLSASISEISTQVLESTRISEEAAQQAQMTSETVGSLEAAAEQIGRVVSLINDIASQTNLLALNATIEAARAGDAGKGFAVVASEVKGLATQTGKATEEISAQISGMQAEAVKAVAAIRQISETITRVSAIANSIASAVEEQSSATQEIGRSVQEAATGTQQVSKSIAQVNDGARETGTAATQVQSVSQQLAQQSENLADTIGGFLNRFRAA